MSDMWSTVAAERGALAADLADLSDQQWKTPSLCDGWTVREVLAHQTGTASMSTPKFLTRLAAAGFRFPTFANREIQRHLGDSPRATLAEFRDKQHSTSSPPGPKLSWLGEVIVHSEDIRRPLGIRHEYPASAVRQVFDFYKGSNTLIGTKSRIADLRLTATDDDWNHGEGPTVEGRLIDLLMAATGRGVACESLAGDGVSTLRLRCS
jgi:uncharacterized protein (TIGR03083 family)